MMVEGTPFLTQRGGVLYLNWYQLDITEPAIVHILAPIKRPLSRKNTPPSQKMMSFFCWISLQIGMRPFCLSAPEFSIVMVWTFR